jgi:hypothetical protein
MDCVNVSCMSTPAPSKHGNIEMHFKAKVREGEVALLFLQVIPHPEGVRQIII